MDRNEYFKETNMEFGEMESSYFLIGLLNEFVNRLQTKGDTFFEEISWKQCFLIICVNLFPKPPTMKELASAVGSSHQNVKQMLLKLEKKGFVSLKQDEEDKRKLRITLTPLAESFNQKYDKPSAEFMTQLYHGIDAADLEKTVETLIKIDKNLKEM